MPETKKRSAWTLSGVLLLSAAIVIAVGCITAATILNNSWVLAGLALSMVCVVLATLGADKDPWHGFKASAPLGFERGPVVFSIVEDHRDLFGAGEVRHVLSGSGFHAFDVVSEHKREWFYVIPLSQEFPDTEFSQPIPGRIHSDLMVVSQPEMDAKKWAEFNETVAPTLHIVAAQFEVSQGEIVDFTHLAPLR